MELLTEKQLKFINSLLSERKTILGIEDVQAYMDDRICKLSKKDASTLIGNLLDLGADKVEIEGLDLRDICMELGRVSTSYNGREYRNVHLLANDGTRLRISYSPNSNGWVNVKAGSEYGRGENVGTQRPNQGYEGSYVEDLEAFVKDPAPFVKRYAEVTGTCCACGKTLEDPFSLIRGMGIICWDKWSGMFSDEHIQDVQNKIAQFKAEGAERLVEAINESYDTDTSYGGKDWDESMAYDDEEMQMFQAEKARPN